MRSTLARFLSLPLAAVLLASVAAPGLAQEDGTRDDPGEQGQAIGTAGTALAMLRLLPDSVPSDSILPGIDRDLPGTTAFEGAFGLAGAEANSAALLTYERAIAMAAPFAGSLGGVAPARGSLVQTALPDNAQPLAGGFTQPDNPLSALVRTEGTKGTAHARWSPGEGPCVGTIASSSTESTTLTAGNAVPTVPDWSFTDLPLPLSRRLAPTGKLGTLGGLLAGTGQSADGARSLVGVDGLFRAESAVRLVDQARPKKGRAAQGKAVESTSTLRAKAIDLFPGTPQAMRLTVATPPTLRVTSTGDEKTSRVSYTAPVLRATFGSKNLFVLDAKRRSQDIPIGVASKDLERLPGAKSLSAGPIVGGYALNRKGRAFPLSAAQQKKVLDLFVLRVSVGGLDQQGKPLTAPYRGHQLGASARLLDLQLLPTEALADAVGERGEDLPSSLAQISLGEQVARASAPAGGVRCGATAAPPAAGPAVGVPGALVPAASASRSMPLFWAGAAALLLGVVLVSVFPRRLRRAAAPEEARKPSPRPRS